jgi:hypothetical protein
VLALTVGAIVASLLIGAQTWWARYAPQLWWLPVAAVVAGLALPRAPAVRSVAAGLAALLLADAALVAFAHFRWEIAATRAERAQFAFLRRQGVVEVDLHYFSEPFSERLRAAGVRFHATQIPAGSPSVELMSVAPGYPAPVRARLPDATGFPPPPLP